MEKVTQPSTKASPKGKEPPSWPLTDKEVAEREAALRSVLGELLVQRDKLAIKKLRLAEVKEEIKLTDLGQEQEELKGAVKELEDGVTYLAVQAEALTREVLDRCTLEAQTGLPAAGAAAPKGSAAERTLPLPGAETAPKGKAATGSPASKATKKAEGKEAPAAPRRSKPAASPLPPPEHPAKGHPQRVLRGWLYARLCQAGELTAAQLSAEAPAYHPEYVRGTLALLEACELVMPWHNDELGAFENESGRSIDERVQDVVCEALAGAPLDASTLAQAMKAPFAVVWDVLEELREAGRVTRKGDLWEQTYGDEEAAE